MADEVLISDETLAALMKAKQSQAAVKVAGTKRDDAKKVASDAVAVVETTETDFSTATTTAKVDAEAAVSAVRKELGLDV